MPAPLIIAALAAGAGRAGIGFAQNRGNVRRQRRLIQEAYRTSADRLDTDQNAARQSGMESLAARGLLQGGSAERIDQSTELNSTDARITRPEDWKAAGVTETRDPMRPMVRTQTANIPTPVRAPTTLAGQTRADMEREMGFEWKELDMQRRQAETDLKAAGQQGTVDAIAAGVNTGMSVYSIGQAMGAGASPAAPAGDYGTSANPGGMFGGAAAPAAARPSMIRGAMTGAADASNWFGGINGLDPLHAPGSSWNQTHGGTMIGGGQSNAEFNVSP